MKLIFSVRNLVFLALTGMIMAIAACSSGISSGGTATAALGLPTVEMKCNGQPCIQ